MTITVQHRMTNRYDKLSQVNLDNWINTRYTFEYRINEISSAPISGESDSRDYFFFWMGRSQLLFLFVLPLQMKKREGRSKEPQREQF